MSESLQQLNPNKLANMAKKSFFQRHYKKIRAATIWAVFFGIAYLFRSFFSLIFITFILTYAINSLIIQVSSKVTWPRLGIVLLIYSILGIVFVGMGMMVLPKVYKESKTLTIEIPEAKNKFMLQLNQMLADDDLQKLVESSGIQETGKEWITSLLQSVTTFLQNVLRTSFHFLLSLVFSFLIIWDLDRLQRDVQGLRETRFGKIYQTIAPPLYQFGSVVGKAFEAQIMIACANTILTLIGLTVLQIPNQLFLSVFVFFCSFIPVLGVFISTLPMSLIAIKQGGLILAFYCVLMIAVVHFVEAYILNPRIVGSHFSLHPFLAVCILVISETWFGVWGLLLGVPCAVFFYRSFILFPEEEKGIPVQTRNGKKILQKA